MNETMRWAVAIFGAVALVACGSDDGGGSGDGTTGGDSDFLGGQFQLTTQAVTDDCLDGGLDLTFMPDGAGTPRMWQKADGTAILTELPAEGDLPKGPYDIALPEPFQPVGITVEAGAAAGTMQVRNSTLTGTPVDEDAYPDCVVDMSIDADITVVDASNVSLATTLTLSNWTGADCPQAADGCTVRLDLTGARP